MGLGSVESQTIIVLKEDQMKALNELSGILRMDNTPPRSMREEVVYYVAENMIGLLPDLKSRTKIAV